MDLFDLRLWEGFAEAGGDGSAAAWIDQVSIDSRQIDSRTSLFVALSGIQTDGHHFASKSGAKFALVRKGYKPTHTNSSTQFLFVDNPLTALQEIAKSYRKQLPTKIVAITGSYGKTMVKDLLCEMLKSEYHCTASPESFNSQIGVPLSIFTISKEHQIAIIEAAISEKNEMENIAKMLNPDFGIITQLGKKHIDRLGSMQTLITELLKLYNLGDRLEWICLPRKEEILPFLNGVDSKIYFWNIDESDAPHAMRLSARYETFIPYQIRFPDSKTHTGLITSGYHYYLDLLNMTTNAAFRLGVPSEKIAATLESYILEPIRKEIWKSSTGATFINDSYAEEPSSIDQALKFMKNNSGEGRKIVLFGGLKGNRTDEDYRSVGTLFAEYNPDLIVLVGDKKFKSLIECLSEKNPSVSIVKTNSFAEAFALYALSIHNGDTVLIKGAKKEPIEAIIKAFHETPCTSLCQVNLAAIEHNIKILRNKLPPATRMMVMVKAFAYGTDTFRIAKFLSTCGIDILGVSYVEEGILLKSSGITQDIFVLNAAEYEVEQAVKWDLEVGVSSSHMIDLLGAEAASQNKKIKVHLHIDTGMSRFGCPIESALTLGKQIASHSSLELNGIMTHFAASDDPKEDAFTYAQVKKLGQAITSLEEQGIHPTWRHAANSAAVLRFSFPQFNMARVGLAIYGLQPSIAGESNHLRLAVSLISRIAGINICRAGDTISYGRSYLVEEKEKKVAVLPIGYFDGLHRNYSGKGCVLIRGEKAPMIGKICMDFMMVDVTDIPNVKIGDPVLIFGEDDHGHYLSPEELALQGNSISHELITCLGPRIQRFFIYEESESKGTSECQKITSSYGSNPPVPNSCLGSRNS